MIRLAMLLVGAPAFRRRWWVLPVVGALWIAVGAFLIVDATDGELRFATDVLGLVLALEGALSLLALLLSPAEMRPALMWRAGVLLALGALILLPLAADEVADRVLFGAAFLVDGALRVGAAWVVRFAGWRGAVGFGLLQLVAAFLVMGNWPVHHGYVVPMALGFVLISSGWALCVLGTQLRNLAPGASITTLPMFFARGWYGADGPPRPHADAHPGFDPPQPMLLLDPDVWLAAAVRRRGATMAWTPGLVLDYARLLRAIVARHRKSQPAELKATVST